MDKEQDRRSPIIKLIPYALIVVGFVGWEVVKRTPIFVSTTVSQQALRVHGLISGSVLLIFTCIVFARFCLSGEHTFYLYGFERYLFILLVVDIAALAVGLIHRNALVFLIGDTYKFAVVPLAYFCTVQALKPEDAWKLLMFIVILETAVTLESFGVYAVRLAAGTYERAPEHTVSLLAFIFFLAALASDARLPFIRRGMYWAALVMIGLTAVLSQARTLWVQVFLCPLLLLLVARDASVIRSVLKLAGVTLLVMLIAFTVRPTALRRVTCKLGQRVVETLVLVQTTDELTPRLSKDRRVVETKAALSRHLESPNALNFIVGFGNGAEFYAPTVALGMGSRPGYKHHIHNGYLSLFFRMGLVGLALFLLFALAALRSMYSVCKRRAEKVSAEHLLISKVVFVYFVETLVEFLTIYSFIGDIRWGVLLGIFRRTLPDHGYRDNR